MQPKVIIRCRRLRCNADVIMSGLGLRVAVCDGIAKTSVPFYKSLREVLDRYKCSVTFSTYENAEALLKGTEEQDIIFYLLKASINEELEAIGKMRKQYKNSKIILAAESGIYLKEAYKAQPFRYLYLSDSEAEIQEALISAVNSLKERKCLVLEGNGKYYCILLKDVLYIEALGDEIGIFTIDGKEYILRMPLKQIFLLIGEDFIKFNRQLIVNARHIDSLKSVTGVLINNEEVAISERERKNVVEKYAEYVWRMKL